MASQIAKARQEIKNSLVSVSRPPELLHCTALFTAGTFAWPGCLVVFRNTQMYRSLNGVDAIAALDYFCSLLIP